MLLHYMQGEKIDPSGIHTFYFNIASMSLFVLYICKHMENMYSFNAHHAFPHRPLQMYTSSCRLYPYVCAVCNRMDSRDHLACLINCNCESQHSFHTHSRELWHDCVLQQQAASSHPSILQRDALKALGPAVLGWTKSTYYVCIRRAREGIVMRHAFFIEEPSFVQNDLIV